MMVVCASDSPRSAIISTKSRRLNLNRRYHPTHSMMMSRPKWRPANNLSTLSGLAIRKLTVGSAASVADHAAHLHQSRIEFCAWLTSDVANRTSSFGATVQGS